MSKKSKKKTIPQKKKPNEEAPVKNKEKRKHLALTISLFVLTIIGSTLWFMSPPTVTEGKTEIVLPQKEPKWTAKYVVIHLDTMSLDLHDGTTTITMLPLLTKGKPGSYYETIGGRYLSDYKIPLHFSSIGHVYMPYSVHLFGNYFIHGIPYYPYGTQVSSTYSGGCIRLSDENAKIVYDFVEKGTPIIVTSGDEYSFSKTKTASSTRTSIEMTNLMVASISLETLTQDDQILDTDGITITTRKTILPRLVRNNDSSVATLYARESEQQFVKNMNMKAESLGLTNTHFTDVTSPVMTTQEDYEQFMNYITVYKSYLRTLQ